MYFVANDRIVSVEKGDTVILIPRPVGIHDTPLPTSKWLACVRKVSEGKTVDVLIKKFDSLKEAQENVLKPYLEQIKEPVQEVDCLEWK